MAYGETTVADATANTQPDRQSEGLPVGCANDALPHLRRPFTPEAIRFKVQTVFSEASGCLIVAYIDARLVSERLNLVCGSEWEAHPVRYADQANVLGCELTVFGRRRFDVGESPKGFGKDLWSDALKRAAVPWGIGVSVYALPQITLWARDALPKAWLEARTVGREKKKTLALTEKGHESLRGGYRNWLEQYGVPLFGKALDHGDVEGQVVDPDVEEESGEDFAPAPPPPVDDARAEGLRTAIKATYDEIAELPAGRLRIPPARYQAWLIGAQHDHGELERLLSHLEASRDEIRTQREGGEQS